MISSFAAATRILAGVGALDVLHDEFRRLGARRVAVIADGGLIELGVVDRIIRDTRIEALVVATVPTETDPSPASVEIGAAAAARSEADAILGIGGGSALGAAKAIALLLRNDVPVMSLEGVDRAAHQPVPVIAVPTTAGSGSEVSSALVLHQPGRVREIVIRGDGYQPKTAVLDATVLRDLPRTPLLYAALDALSHAMEALWARGASLFSEACALRAVPAILESLPVAARGALDGANHDGANDSVLQNLMEASSLANLACGNSGLALVHALSSSPSVPLAHGLQNGILLPHVARWNRDVLPAAAREYLDRIDVLYDVLGFSARFPAGVADADAMVEASRGHVFRENNRRSATDDDLRELLDHAGAASSASLTGEGRHS